MTSQRKIVYSYGVAKGKSDAGKADVLQGTLDLMILKTLESMGPLHGYGIARRLEQISEDVLKLNEGTVYASLMRLQHEGWISASWGASENNRRAKFYSITSDRPAPAPRGDRAVGAHCRRHRPRASSLHGVLTCGTTCGALRRDCASC